MTERTKELVKKIAAACVERHQGCPDYGGFGEKAATMAMNFFCGAASFAKIQGDEELVNHLTKIIVFMLSIRGIEEVYKLAEIEVPAKKKKRAV